MSEIEEKEFVGMIEGMRKDIDVIDEFAKHNTGYNFALNDILTLIKKRNNIIGKS